MQISILNADDQLDDLVGRAEAGEEVVLTRDGPAAPLTSIDAPITAEVRKHLLSEIRNAAADKASPGPTAARSQDFLYR